MLNHPNATGRIDHGRREHHGGVENSVRMGMARANSLVLVFVVTLVGVVVWSAAGPGIGSFGGPSGPVVPSYLSSPVPRLGGPFVSTFGAMVISSNTSLAGDLFAKSVMIGPGVTLWTNGFSIVVSGTFDNSGTVIGGLAPHHSYFKSYGGSGGGADSYTYASYARNGSATLVPGGAKNTSYVNSTGTARAGNGSTPISPTLNRSILRHWFFDGMFRHLSGAGGGSINRYVTGGAGSFGIYIQAKSIIAGVIEAQGEIGSGTCSGIGLSGGGGGGVILLAYGSGGLTPGAYNVTGGPGVPSFTGNVYSGSGGMGQVSIFAYGIRPPI
jgi:hypothetical protein